VITKMSHDWEAAVVTIRYDNATLTGADEAIPVGTSIIDQIGIALLHIGAAHPDCDILAGLVDRIGGEQS